MRLTIPAALAACLLAQQPPAFEVASIKARPAGSPIGVIGGQPSGSRLTLEAMSLSDLISWAYNVKPWQVAGGPPWAGTQDEPTVLNSGTRRFDIAAKAEGEAPRPPEEFRAMMQSLLADRFHLVLHRQTRDMRVYALVIDKGGSKLRQSAADGKSVLRMNGGGHMVGTGATVTQLVDWFSNASGVDRPIVDRTGLTGRYDFTLEWRAPRAGDTPDLSSPDIFTAMPTQLGLRLRPQTAPVGVLTIDSAEMPGGN